MTCAAPTAPGPPVPVGYCDTHYRRVRRWAIHHRAAQTVGHRPPAGVVREHHLPRLQRAIVVADDDVPPTW